MTDLGRSTIKRVNVRLLPFLFLLYFLNFLDRSNVAIAALQMNRDLHFSAAAYGLGAGIFFIGYSLFEVPSNLMLVKFGARRWIARIMISWGVIACAMMFVRTPMHFYTLRFLLGVAEAGFLPGIVFYLSEWYPAAERARAIAKFMIAIPLSAAIGNPISGYLLKLDGVANIAGWQWVFLLEGLPSVVIGFLVLRVLHDNYEDAKWLSAEQRSWLRARMKEDGVARPHHGLPPLRALMHPAIILASIAFFFALNAAYSYTFWAPTVVRDGLHASNTATALITGAIGFFAAIVVLLVGTSADRTRDPGIHAVAVCVLAAVGYAGAALLHDPVARVLAFALVPAGIYSLFAPFWCLPTAILGGSGAAAGVAFINSVGNLGGLAGPYIVGVLKDLTGGTNGAFLGLAVMSLVAAGLCFILRQWVRREQQQKVLASQEL